MGTRNLTSVIVDGETKIAQYGQWDGYPTGVGNDIVRFLKRDDLVLDEFRDKVRGLRWLSEEEKAARWAEFTNSTDGWVTMDESYACAKKYPQMSRDTGAGILGMVYAGGVDGVVDDSSFADDALFCEWAYVVDLDAETVTVVHGYKNRQKDVYSFAEFVADGAMQKLEEGDNEEED